MASPAPFQKHERIEGVEPSPAPYECDAEVHDMEMNAQSA